MVIVANHYAARSIDASIFRAFRPTRRGLAQDVESPHAVRVFDSDEFLQRVLQKAGTQAAMARALEKPTSRIAEMFKPKGAKRKRVLTMEDGMALAQAFDLPPCEGVSAERLMPILRVCLRYAPKGAWSDQDVRHLAEGIEYGLELLKTTNSSPPSQDAIEVAANAIARRLQRPPA